uniref:T1.8 protein n=1 Tax=Malus x robusta TaxID=1184610 RepID=I7J3I1_9ROSA|nr:T1.8 [Malus x robusta]
MSTRKMTLLAQNIPHPLHRYRLEDDLKLMVDSISFLSSRLFLGQATRELVMHSINVSRIRQSTWKWKGKGLVAQEVVKIGIEIGLVGMLEILAKLYETLAVTYFVCVDAQNQRGLWYNRKCQVDVASSLEVRFLHSGVVSLTGGDAQGVSQVAELGDLSKEVTDKVSSQASKQATQDRRFDFGFRLIVLLLLSLIQLPG